MLILCFRLMKVMNRVRFESLTRSGDGFQRGFTFWLPLVDWGFTVLVVLDNLSALRKGFTHKKRLGAVS